MLKKKNNAQNDKIETIVGAETDFKGNISSKGVIRVDGKIEGDIATGENLIVGEQGKVHANIKSKSVTIAGEVNGNIDCSENLEILSSGKLYGDVKVNNLFIDDGAVFDGNCEMKQKKEQQQNKQKQGNKD